MNEFFKDILPIGVFLTFIGTLITLYYTRRNLKTTKYIDTITSERIKWIEKLRDDLSTLTSWITIFVSNNKYLNQLIDESEELEHQDFQTNPHEDEPWPMIMKEMADNKGEQNMLVSELKGVSRLRIIEKIHLIKLRLNPNDDIRAIELLDILLEFFTPPKFETKKSEEVNNAIKEFITISQQILKDEWDKIKTETKKGK
ncbi:hypothetical protein [Carboxylicivirga taeanensis]|uniref:hypothetical protein n=1 Tax=Carboxylicivirga taeanensis TaxID=1416875 RepID=UPI003F6E1BFF